MRKLILTIFVLIVVVIGVNAKVFTAVSLNINNEKGVFKKGEKIVFTGKMHEPLEVPLVMTVFENGIEIEKCKVDLTSDNTVIYECSYDEPASVIVQVGVESDKKSFASVGVVVAPDEFKPGFKEPEDFLEYWKKQIARLRKSKAKVFLTPVNSSECEDGYNAFALEISMPEGNPVRGYVAMPSNAKTRSLPIVVYTHGAGVDKPGNRSHIKTAVKYAKMGSGAIALDINAHGFLNDQPDEYYKELNRGELKNYRSRELTTRDEYYFRLMFLRLVRAVDYLCSMNEWDGKRLAVVGESQGGLQTAAIACLDHRVNLSILTCPAHTDLAGPRQGRKSSWPGIYDIAMKSKPDLIDDILPYFDGVNFLRHVQSKIVVEVGLSDMTSPPACVYAGYNVCPSVEKIIMGVPHRPHSASNIHPDYIKSVQTLGWKKKRILDDFLK